MCDFVGNNDNSSIVQTDVIHQNIGFCILQFSVNVNNVEQGVSHESDSIFAAHWNDYIFPGQTFSSHLNMVFQFILTMNNVVNLIDFFAFNAGKISLIFRTSDMLVVDLDTCAYDLPVGMLVDLSLLLFEGFLG